MSPSGGAITTVEPSITWSPENTMRSCSSRKHRWFEAWPGVWMARRTNSVASIVSPSAIATSIRRSSRASKARTSAPVRALRPGGAGRVVGVGVGADDPTDAVAAATGDGVEVVGVVGPRIDDDDLVDAHEVGVGAGPGHHPGVGGDDATHQRAERAGHAVDQRRARRRWPPRRRRRRRSSPASACGGRGHRGARSATPRRRRRHGGRWPRPPPPAARRRWRSGRSPRGCGWSAGSSSNRPSAWSESASGGRIQVLSVCSRSSCRCSPSGARANEEAGVVPLRSARGRDPVRERVEVLRRQAEPGLLERLAHRSGPERAATARPARGARRRRCRRVRQRLPRPARRSDPPRPRERPRWRRTPWPGGARASRPRGADRGAGRRARASPWRRRAATGPGGRRPAPSRAERRWVRRSGRVLPALHVPHVGGHPPVTARTGDHPDEAAPGSDPAQERSPREGPDAGAAAAGGPDRR